MIGFKIGNVKISFEFGFFAVAALFCLLDAPELALSALCACVIHECGHIFASVLCNVKIEKITLWAGGVKIQTESKIISAVYDVFILLSGPVFNFISAFFYFISGRYSVFSVNLVLGLFNLLPFSNLDGGAVIRKIFEYHEISADSLMKIIAVFSAVFIELFFYFTGTGSFTGYATIIFLLICEFVY